MFDKLQAWRLLCAIVFGSGTGLVGAVTFVFAANLWFAPPALGFGLAVWRNALELTAFGALTSTPRLARRFTAPTLPACSQPAHALGSGNPTAAAESMSADER
jgi:hypothetical protein